MLYRNTAGYIDASMVVIVTGAALEAGTVHAFVRKKSNNDWLQADGSWDAVKPVGANIPTMTHESGGLWRLTHTPADADETYMINCIDSGATCYPDNYQVTILDKPADRIKKNAALSNFTFPMRDQWGNAATGLTVTAERSIDGGAYSACANAVTEIASGAYKISLTAADLNGDVIMLKFTAANARQREFTILTES